VTYISVYVVSHVTPMQSSHDTYTEEMSHCVAGGADICVCIESCHTHVRVCHESYHTNIRVCNESRYTDAIES